MNLTLSTPAETQTSCEPWNSPAHTSAPVVADHHDQGWVLLANGVIVFDDTSELLPDGTVVEPHRNEVRLAVA